jgi:AcrR family transcriptional regulator
MKPSAMKRPGRAKAAPKHRYQPDNAYARGGATRARLIAAALRLFGQRGFDGASTRDIAAAAGLNAPALQYYFDNKEGLYRACARHLVSRVWATMKGVVMVAEGLLSDDADDEALVRAFCDIQVKMTAFLDDANNDWILWVAREQTGFGPRSGSQLIYRRNKRITEVNAAIIGRLLGRARGDAECLTREMLLSGQLLFFHFMRRSALATLALKDLDARHLTLIERVLREHTTASLRAMVAQRSAKAVARPLRAR